jgi:hypothetical protein
MRGARVRSPESLLTGTFPPVIDGTYLLTEARDAIRYLQAGHAQKKTVIMVW